MTMRPDPTFHASPKLAMEAPPEIFAYTLLLSPDFSKPDALAVIDVKPGSPTYSQIVHTVTMPNEGDEFHHFGWNACPRPCRCFPGTPSSSGAISSFPASGPRGFMSWIPNRIRPRRRLTRSSSLRKSSERPATHGRTRSTAAGRHLRQHARRRWQGWYRRAARHLHHGLPDLRGAREMGDRPCSADAAYDFWWNLPRITW